MKTIRWSMVLLPCLGILFCAGAAHAELLGFWEFNEGSGDTVSDSSGKGNNGIIVNAETGGLNNGPVWVNDPERGAVISFGGAADDAYVSLGELIPVMTLEQDFTWAFWANDSSAADQGNNIIVGNRMNSAAADFVPRQFIKFTPTKFEWHMNGNGNDNMEYDASTDAASNDIPNDVWMHHAVVKNGAAITYYRNGVAMNSKNITQPLDQPQPLFLGGDNEGADGENWAGMLDDVRIYDHALSDSEIAELAGVSSSAGEWSVLK